ncbi:hypothetical protein JOB18_030412 [Solea senegalensis]|uniref:Uncharacterized protein n=1 Tax=Solea senegalensis TaxID=28829 RepID=A0AAV6PY73_SOLSE|nr:hypothetical protein JOB18_030412 [Solea senegalensis]
MLCVCGSDERFQLRLIPERVADPEPQASGGEGEEEEEMRRRGGGNHGFTVTAFHSRKSGIPRQLTPSPAETQSHAAPSPRPHDGTESRRNETYRSGFERRHGDAGVA